MSDNQDKEGAHSEAYNKCLLLINERMSKIKHNKGHESNVCTSGGRQDEASKSHGVTTLDDNNVGQEEESGIDGNNDVKQEEKPSTDDNNDVEQEEEPGTDDNNN
eukprot:10419570-Ditylum_brightwellii.AAC.1